MELPLVTALTPRRSIGLNWLNLNQNFRTSIGIFGENVNKKRTDEEAYSINFHSAYTFFNENKRHFHLGLSLSYREPDQASESLAYKVKSETSTTQAPVLKTGAITNVDYANIIGIESLFINKAYKIQGEYVILSLNRSSGFEDHKLNSYYIQLSKMLKGGSFLFDRNRHQFKNKIDKDVWGHGYGAWELAYRFEMLNFNNGLLDKGKLVRNALAFNWHASQHIKISLNYSYCKSDANASIANEDHHIFGIRTHFKF